MTRTKGNRAKWLAVAGCFIAPQLLWATEQSDHQYTARDQIEFSPATNIAFDRSGKYITSQTMSDGSTLTNLNGSMQSVTVARMGADGKIETYCTTDEEAAKDWMAGKIDPQPARLVLPAIQVISK